MKKTLLYTFLGILLILGTLAVNIYIFSKNAQVISQGDPIPDYGEDKAALLVVDIQEGITGAVSFTESYISQSEWLIPRLNDLARMSDSLEIPVIYIRNEVSNPLINILNNTMAAGTEGAKLDQRLKVSSELILAKKKNDAFSNPQLEKILAEMKINHLYFTGLDAASCVNSTMLGAENRDFRITVIGDAVIADTEESWKKMMNEYKARGVRLISSEQFTQMASSNKQ